MVRGVKISVPPGASDADVVRALAAKAHGIISRAVDTGASDELGELAICTLAVADIRRRTKDTDTYDMCELYMTGVGYVMTDYGRSVLDNAYVPPRPGRTIWQN